MTPGQGRGEGADSWCHCTIPPKIGRFNAGLRSLRVKLKGINHPVLIHEIGGVGAPYNLSLELPAK